jgi:hypothetical protein
MSNVLNIENNKKKLRSKSFDLSNITNSSFTQLILFEQYIYIHYILDLPAFLNVKVIQSRRTFRDVPSSLVASQLVKGGRRLDVVVASRLQVNGCGVVLFFLYCLWL